MPRTDASRLRLKLRAVAVMGNAGLLRIVAGTITTPVGLEEMLADIDDLPVRDRLRQALTPLLTYPVEAPLSAAPGPVVPAATEGVSAMGNQSLNSLDRADHLTKRKGGTATHSGGSVGTPQREKTAKDPSGHEPVGPSSASNYGSGAKGAHGAKMVTPHGLNKPAAGKKMHK